MIILFIYLYLCIYTYLEADSKGAVKVPVYQESEEKLVPNRSDR